MEQRKLTKIELETITSLQSKYSEMSIELGNIEFQLKELSDRKKQVLELYSETRKEEISFTKDLNTKYGDGIINIETGEIKDK